MKVLLWSIMKVNTNHLFVVPDKCKYMDIQNKLLVPGTQTPKHKTSNILNLFGKVSQQLNMWDMERSEYLRKETKIWAFRFCIVNEKKQYVISLSEDHFM